MYTFFQLLTRNALLAVLFSFCILSVAIYSTSSLVEQKQNSQQQWIKALATQMISSGDLNELKTTLKINNNIARLMISNNEITNEFSYVNPNQVFELGLIAPEPVTFKLDNNTTVSFTTRIAEESAFLLQIIITTLIVSLIFTVIAAMFTLKKYKHFFKSISVQIKKDLSLVTTQEANQTQDNKDIFEIPALKEGINEIKLLLDAQRADTTILEKEAFVDSLTGIDNRSRFVHYFENQVGTGKVKFGVLFITRCSELQTINQIHGYNGGDDYICQVANIMKTLITPYKGGQLFRLNSSDFATILPNVTLSQAEKYAKDLTGKFNEYQQASDLDSVAYTGLVQISSDKPLGELLALADTGISVAQTQHINSWFAQKDSDILNSSSANYGNQNWRQEIEHVLENQRVSLLVQYIQPSTKNKRVYGEILARFLNSNDEMLPTASFIAMAEKLDKIVAVDRLIVESAINEINDKNLLEHSFGINISARSIHDEHFLIWLERRLLRETKVTSRLIFEISEYGLQQNIKSSKRFIDMIHRAGARVTVERFGVGLTSFKFFRDLKPDFIKMDSTYTRDIDEDKNNQYFLRLMVDLAHRLSINVLAESVESQEEKHTLEKLFIDGCQGFYIGKPSPL